MSNGVIYADMERKMAEQLRSKKPKHTPATTDGEPPKLSPTQQLKNERDDLKRTVTELDAKLQATEARDGSLFDLKRDTAEDIADVIWRTVTPDKVKAIVKRLNTHLKRKSTPAG